MAQIVTLQRHYSMAGAIVAQSLLAHHDIPAFVFDRNVVVTDWGYLFAVGGLRLSVLDHDLQAARDVLAAARAENPPDGGPGCCPACGSGNVFRRARWLAGVLFILLSIVYDVPSRSRTCLDCRHKWRAAHRHD
jgi:hypothetical protein